MNERRPMQSRIKPSNIGRDTSIMPVAFAIGTEVAKASAVPSLAVAISRPIANASSFPLNHL